MKIIKRSGEEVDFKIEKIKNAVKKASDATEEEKLTIAEIETIANNVFQKLQSLQRECNVEEIQNFVEDEILNCGHYQIAKNYITYRYKRTLARRANTTDDAILSLIDCLNEEAKQENSNKNPTIASVQRDYMAGEVSKDISKRILLPKDVIEAHEKGLIHFHDMDYFSQHIHNCCLINLEDMLQNGTVISGTMIEKPHSFRAACNIATQIIAQVASSQYGGQSISLTHLAPFVQISREAIRKEVTEEFELMKEDDILKDADTQKAIEEIVEKRLRKEIKNGVQTIQYQVVTLLTTNGQAPFVTVFMYLNEAKNEQEKKDLAIIIEETLKQRIEGVKNEKGVWITPAFPKLIYVLEEDNVDKDSKYFYLTELAAKCTAKRLVPDYISEKIMLQLKGDVYTPMGCVAGNEVITYRYNNQVFTESFERMWAHLTKYFEIKRQPNNCDWYIETKGVEIYDQKVGFTNVYCVIKNHNSNWVRLKFSNGRILTCTKDHPFETVDGRIVEAANLKENDLIEIDKKSNFAITQNENTCHIKEIQNFVEDSFSYDVTTESEHFTVSGVYSHNCRSFLTPDRFTAAGVGNVAKAKNYVEGKKKYYGRFNQGVVTINLPDVALSANQVTLGESYNVVTDDELFSKNLEENFWKIFDERLDLCFKALMCRHNRLKGTSSDVAPILWQYGALARLNKGEPIDKLLYDGYSTISLGYAGLYECTKCITGMSHTDENGGKQFALKVMQHMNDKCNEWKAATNIDFSIYGTPLESTTYKFAKCLQKRFGIIKGITDKNYITNSYHVHVTEEIDAFTKLKFESAFQALSPGGAISYIEVPNMQDNIPAVLQVMKFIYNNIMYAELNTKSDYCQCCGYDGEIKIVEKDNKLIWHCPNCGNEDQNKMNVARRTCGYIGTQFWNQGRTQEIKDRVLHL